MLHRTAGRLPSDLAHPDPRADHAPGFIDNEISVTRRGGQVRHGNGNMSAAPTWRGALAVRVTLASILASPTRATPT